MISEEKNNKISPKRCFWALTLAISLFGESSAEARLSYYSDYFSFVGWDEKGWVTFALDTNRGQDGEEFQAEHFAVLYVEGSGWVQLKGNGNSPNTKKTLTGLPDSEYFHFSGNPAAGLLIESQPNDLSLRVRPIITRLNRQRRDDRYRMGSTSASMMWKGRTLKGRVIHEFISLENWNRLTRTYVGYWKDFHGLYLMTHDAETGRFGDFYLHRHRNKESGTLTGMVGGFAVIDGENLRLENIRVEVTGNSMALGIYRWPRSWKGYWQQNNSSGTLDFELELVERKTFSNWVIGGFAMGIVRGFVLYRHRRLAVYGLAEIIK
jgi:hypothetical protein